MPLQTDEIKYAGQAIAFVVAESIETARFAADLITTEHQKIDFEAEFTAAKSKSHAAENFAKPNTKVGDFQFSALGRSKTGAETQDEKFLRRGRRFGGNRQRDFQRDRKTRQRIARNDRQTFVTPFLQTKSQTNILKSSFQMS